MNGFQQDYIGSSRPLWIDMNTSHPNYYPVENIEPFFPEEYSPASSKSERKSSDQQKLSLSNGEKKKKRRILFTKQQTAFLEQRFMVQQYPSAPERELLAQHTGLTATQCKIWFQNQ